MIVFCVAHADRVVRGNPELGERGEDARGFVDVRGQHHHCPFVEHDLELEAEVANGVEHGRLIWLPRRDDRATHRQRTQLELFQPGHELLVRRRTKAAFFGGCGVVQHRTVLGDDAVEQRQIRKHAPQIAQVPSRDQHHAPARLLEPLQSLADLRLNQTVMRERAVVVGNQGEEIHPPSLRASGIRR